ncbi:MAG TPA: NAD(P)/FAD-dependent oxidoreductase [Longimicrobiales bacterium]|nr:NAD(P)/FAD-dependent oxidoreductase [Longimicrobiales bacterium]
MDDRIGTRRIDTDVVVVGAGPAGLAVAACVARAGLTYRLFEREEQVAPSWRRHYDRLHLHTSRRFSGLPFLPMPRRYPRYPSRAQVVAYLEDYARSLGLTPELGVEVRKIEAAEPGWRVETTIGTVTSAAVVVATGANGVPNLPEWPGLDGFPGPVLHSSAYRDGISFRGRDVLIVGLGNSGGEIALDLLEHGARPVLSVRSPVNVVPRDILGLPILAIAIPLSRLPPMLADALVWPILRAYYPSYARLGLRKARHGPFRQIRERGRIPLLDIGTVREIRRGTIRVVGEVEHIAGSEVRFRDGGRRMVDAIVLATGFRSRPPAGVTAPDPVRPMRRSRPGPPDHLRYCGFYVSPTGMLREIGREARLIAVQLRIGLRDRA